MNKDVKGLIKYLLFIFFVGLLPVGMFYCAFAALFYDDENGNVFLAYLFLLLALVLFILYIILPVVFTYKAMKNHWSKYLDKFFYHKLWPTIVFILFILLSFILFKPVRNMLKKRQDKITSDRENAEADKKEALAMKQEYEAKLKAANKEAEGILSDARKVAKHNEEKIVADAKQEAARIIARANTEAELEKQKAADEVKQQIIAVARLMASKVVAESISEADSQALIEQTLNEMGDKTWLS